MKQVVIISGKGGTGKTVIAGSFAALAKDLSAVIVDCDVDAPDLHLLLEPKIQIKRDFKGLSKAKIYKEKCIECLDCINACRFDAIMDSFDIDENSCEGCKFCFHICPVQAIEMVDNTAGEYYISKTSYGPMVHAQLGVAEENSGKLVTIVRNEARIIAEQDGHQLVIIDGPPGIGCPAIASISGVDLTVIVTEPTVTAMHDLERVSSLTRHFGIKTSVIINKFDLDEKNSEKIYSWGENENVEVVGKIPFDPVVSKSIVAGVPLVEYESNRITNYIEEIFYRIKEKL